MVVRGWTCVREELRQLQLAFLLRISSLALTVNKTPVSPPAAAGLYRGGPRRRCLADRLHRSPCFSSSRASSCLTCIPHPRLLPTEPHPPSDDVGRHHLAPRGDPGRGGRGPRGSTDPAPGRCRRARRAGRQDLRPRPRDPRSRWVSSHIQTLTPGELIEPRTLNPQLQTLNLNPKPKRMQP